MDLQLILYIIQVVISVALIVFIILQQQGSGLGSMFGGGGESYRSKRGFEKFLFNGTVILITLFVVNGLAIAIFSAQA